MVWPDMCSWASCLGKRKEEADDLIAPRPVSKLAYDIDHHEISEKKFAKSLQPPPPPPSIASEPPQRRSRRERNLPPVPPMPVSSVYEIGVSSPRTGVSRSNSKSSISTTASIKKAKKETQYLEKQTRPSVGLRRPSQGKPGLLTPEKQAVESNSPSSVHKSPTHKRSVSSVDQRDGKKLPFPITARSSSRRMKKDHELPIACDDEATDERELRRRSDSAPIPLKNGLLGASLKHTHTIRRKPVTPKTSLSFTQLTTEGNRDTEASDKKLDTLEDPTEMDVPAFELSADPQSRAQSYYADVGIILLTETLDKAPPMPSQPPSLVLDTTLQQRYSILDTASSKRFTFSPMTTVSSPVENPHVSPITPWTRRSRNKITMAKRSKSVGSPSMSRLPASVKRRSLDDEEESRRPTLPASTYAPSTPPKRSNTSSLLKAELSEDSSHRASDASEKSENSSRSSLPSRGPSPSYMDKVKIMKRRRRPEQDTETLRPIAFQRRSTTAPIPILSTDDMPSVPRLPPQAYHFTTAKPQTPSNAGGLVRSLSTKNLRTQEAAHKLPKFGRSKSIYYQVSAWNDSDTPQSPHLDALLPPLPQHPASIPLPESDTDSDIDSDYDSEFESEYGSAKSGLAAELDSHGQQQYLVETGPRSLLTTPIEREDPIQGAWGKGLGAEWGVAY